MGVQALADGRCPSAVYGAEHLLRLLHKLAEILPLAALSDDQLSTIATMVQVRGWAGTLVQVKGAGEGLVGDVGAFPQLSKLGGQAGGRVRHARM